jgi:hypothetical protein
MRGEFMSVSLEEFLRCKEYRDLPGFRFMPGMRVWHDFTQADSPYADDESRILSGDTPDWKVIQALNIGNRWEVTIADNDNPERQPIVCWGDELVPCVNTSTKTMMINSLNHELIFFRKGNWWCVTWDDVTHPVIALITPAAIDERWYEAVVTNKNT